jgi:hypothetical protein
MEIEISENNYELIRELYCDYSGYSYVSKEEASILFMGDIQTITKAIISGKIRKKDYVLGIVCGRDDFREICEFLIESKFPISYKIYKLAIASGKLDKVRYLVDRGIYYGDYDLLLLAIKYQQYEILFYLMSKGCRIDDTWFHCTLEQNPNISTDMAFEIFDRNFKREDKGKLIYYAIASNRPQLLMKAIHAHYYDSKSLSQNLVKSAAGKSNGSEMIQIIQINLNKFAIENKIWDESFIPDVMLQSYDFKQMVKRSKMTEEEKKTAFLDVWDQYECSKRQEDKHMVNIKMTTIKEVSDDIEREYNSMNEDQLYREEVILKIRSEMLKKAKQTVDKRIHNLQKEYIVQLKKRRDSSVKLWRKYVKEQCRLLNEYPERAEITEQEKKLMVKDWYNGKGESCDGCGAIVWDAFESHYKEGACGMGAGYYTCTSRY